MCFEFALTATRSNKKQHERGNAENRNNKYTTSISMTTPADVRWADNECLNPEQMFDLIKKQGWVKSNSGKNRSRLYNILRKEALEWTEETIGYTTGIITLCEWSAHRSRNPLWNRYRHSPKHYARWIKSGRLLQKDVQSIGSYHVDDIAHVWNSSISVKEAAQIIDTVWGHFWTDHDKWFPFNNSTCLRKPIKKIKLKTTPDTTCIQN